jgi:hypothetical protein
MKLAAPSEQKFASTVSFQILGFRVRDLASFRLTVVAAFALLSACGGHLQAICRDTDEPYMHAANNDSLKVPEGMAQPNRSESLEIPAPKADSAKNTAQNSAGHCLDEPPSYFRSTGTVARSPEEVVASWAQAWASREADAVLELYSKNFIAPTDSPGAATWLEQRREQVATGTAPEPRIEKLRIEPDGEDRRLATFVQHFGRNSLRKELVLVREAGSWRIVEEKVSELK